MLTVADIRAVGPGVWNGWKGQLLRTLYYETEPFVAGASVQREGSQRTLEAQETLSRSRQLEFAVPTSISISIATTPITGCKTQSASGSSICALWPGPSRRPHVATDITTDAFTAITELTVVAPNHPRLLALFAGACAAAGANIAGAQS